MGIKRHGFAIDLPGSDRFERSRLAALLPAALAAVILFLCCLATSPPVRAEERRVSDDFAWKKEDASGSELAASRSDSSFNFFDVGDLSYYSQFLVEQDLRRLAGAAGLTMERSPAKSSLVSIVH